MHALARVTPYMSVAKTRMLMNAFFRKKIQISHKKGNHIPPKRILWLTNHAAWAAILNLSGQSAYVHVRGYLLHCI